MPLIVRPGAPPAWALSWRTSGSHHSGTATNRRQHMLARRFRHTRPALGRAARPDGLIKARSRPDGSRRRRILGLETVQPDTKHTLRRRGQRLPVREGLGAQHAWVDAGQLQFAGMAEQPAFDGAGIGLQGHCRPSTRGPTANAWLGQAAVPARRWAPSGMANWSPCQCSTAAPAGRPVPKPALPRSRRAARSRSPSRPSDAPPRRARARHQLGAEADAQQRASGLEAHAHGPQPAASQG